MRLRVVLRSPSGETLTRDVREGTWAEPDGAPDLVIGGDLWALPGLVDAHAHLARGQLDYLPGDADGAEKRAKAAVEAGVGLILDKGWCDLTVVELLDRIHPSQRPDLEAAGVIQAVEGGYVDGFCRNIDPGDVESAVGRAALEGRGWVKLIGDWPRSGIGPVPNFSEAELALAVEKATALGSRVAIHTMAREVPSMAVRAGVHSIEHGLFLTEADLAALGARAGMWVPTVMRVEAVIQQLGAESSGGRLLREGLDNVAALLPLALEAGVGVLTGTDLAVSSGQVALEAVRLWEMGMSPAAVVDAATINGLRGTGRPSRFEVGTPANAALFAENPVHDPRALSWPHTVIRLGILAR